MKKIVFLIAIQLLIVSCGGKNDTPAPAPAPEVPKPSGVAVLKTPSNNQVCTENPVVFKWEDVEYATSYVLYILNSDGTVYKELSQSGLMQTVTLPKGKSFSWKVTAKNEKGETSSETRSFVTEGEAIVNFVPTASIAFNKSDKTASISFYDNDNDQLTYTIYYATENSFSASTILQEHSNKTISSGKTVTLTTLDFNKKIWLKVLVTDAKGNKSEAIGSF